MQWDYLGVLRLDGVLSSVVTPSPVMDYRQGSQRLQPMATSTPNPSSNRVIQVDDLSEDRVYLVHLKNNGFVKLPLAGTILERGKPLILLFFKVATKELISVSADRIERIEALDQPE